MSYSIAIVGSGPSGFYAAEGLLKALPGARIDILDRLPTPFGLVRAGVAPDHQGNKAVARLFAKTAERPGVRFLGGVEIGRDVPLDALRAAYDAVVVASGATEDKRLGIPGEDLRGVVGSFAFAGWINGHPDYANRAPPLDTESVVVVGNGNVAIDMARVLVKTPGEMTKSDIAAAAAKAIRAAPLRDIHIVGRRGPLDAAFTNLELAELGRLERAVALVQGDLPDAAPPEKQANLATLKAFAANDPAAKPLRLHFRFGLAPVEFLGDGTGRLRAVRFDADGASVEIRCGLAVTAIGYRCRPIAGLPYDERGIVANRDGRVTNGLYVVGWAKRGPSGTIATNRSDSFAVAEAIAADLKTGSASTRPGPAALDALGLRPTSWADWKRIDALEIARAAPGAPREKLATWDDLKAALA